MMNGEHVVPLKAPLSGTPLPRPPAPGETVLAAAGRVWNVWVWGISDVSSVVLEGLVLRLSACASSLGCELPAVHQIRALERNAALDGRASFPLLAV